MPNKTKKYEYKEINSKLIYVDKEYQRSLNNYRVREIVTNFNEDLLNPIKVNFRDGRYYCFDGMHTLTALKYRNKGHDLLVSCKVYENQTKEWEANMFADQNGISRQVQTMDRLKAKYLAGDRNVKEFHDATNVIGVLMNFSSSPAVNKIAACSTAYKIYRKLSLGDYFDCLTILKEANSGDSSAFNSCMLKSVGNFIDKYSGKYDFDVLLCQLEKVSPLQNEF